MTLEHATHSKRHTRENHAVSPGSTRTGTPQNHAPRRGLSRSTSTQRSSQPQLSTLPSCTKHGLLSHSPFMLISDLKPQQPRLTGLAHGHPNRHGDLLYYSPVKDALTNLRQYKHRTNQTEYLMRVCLPPLNSSPGSIGASRTQQHPAQQKRSTGSPRGMSLDREID